MPRVRETIADRVEKAEAQPIDPTDIVSEGAWTIEAAAEFSGYSAASLRRAIDTGHLPVIHGEINRVLIPRKALRLYLERRLAFRRNLVIVPIEPEAPDRQSGRANR